MYTPFARKYRPRKFSEVAGQEVPVRVLLNAVRQNKLSHAYLFAGPRGTGKTTLARILTRAINCLNPKDGEPCGECENCIAIDRGSFPDLIEIDAASNRGIDDIRAIRDAVSYSPIKGKYKVYILDEAHMLTKEAFNALLKTLEEPPPRTVFILCTTEYEKILPTILSRCQRLIFSKLKEEDIVAYLKMVCERENLECEEGALRLIARVSDGGMRDALSLLDQASTYGEGRVKEELLEEFLGIVSQERVRDFLKLLLNSEVDQALSFLRSIAERGFNLLRFWDSLEEELQSLLLYKSLKNPDLVIKVEDFHKEMSQVPLNALLYLEKVINATRVDARTRDFLKACELAVIKANIVKDIMSLSELASLLMAQPEKPQSQDTPKEQPKDPFEELRGKLDRLTFEALKRSKHELKEDKLIFYIKEGDLSKEQIEKVKTLFPKVEFVVEAQEKKEEELPEFTKKVKDLFGAKIVSHERDKGKDTPS